jgi:flagellar export protein FliJ
MANLLSLIKLRKHTVDEKQKVLADLYRQIESIEQSKNTLIERLRNERATIDKSGMLEMYAYFGRFSQNVQRMIERLNAEKEKLEMRIRIAQDDVREAFAGMKRIEIVQKERERAEKKEQADKESREMDDIGIDGFRRQEEMEDR